jgi:signal peptidase II
VIDFIDVYYEAWHWPAFNLADSAITMGAVMLVIDAMGAGSRNRN